MSTAPLGSILASKALVALAFELAEPSILQLLSRSKRPRPNFVHIVVLNPIDLTYADDLAHIAGVSIPDKQKENILGEKTFGPAPENRANWKRDYAAIALSKTLISQRTGQSSGYIATERPALLMAKDVHFAGSDVTWGVPVGASGVESFIDEAASRIVGATIDMLVKEDLQDCKDKEVIFLE